MQRLNSNASYKCKLPLALNSNRLNELPNTWHNNQGKFMQNYIPQFSYFQLRSNLRHFLEFTAVRIFFCFFFGTNLNNKLVVAFSCSKLYFTLLSKRNFNNMSLLHLTRILLTCKCKRSVEPNRLAQLFRVIGFKNPLAVYAGLVPRYQRRPTSQDI